MDYTFIIFLSSVIVHVSGLHVNCSMTITINDSTIRKVNTSLVHAVSQRQGFDANTCKYAQLQREFCGYSTVSLSTELDHFQHQATSWSEYDDIVFSDWKTMGSSVVVNAFSGSEYPNAYDYDANFCNIFNLFRNGNVSALDYDLAIDYGYCKFHPDTTNGFDPAYSQCNKY